MYAITDRSGWWNLIRVAAAGGEPEPVHAAAEEFGAPQWGLGQRTYAVLADGRLAVTHGTGQRALGLLDPASGVLTDLDLPYTNWAPSIRVDGTTLVAVAGSPKTSTGVVVVDLDTAAVEVVKTASALSLDARYLPDPTIEGLPGPSGRTVHAVVYPPANPDLRGSGG